MNQRLSFLIRCTVAAWCMLAAVNVSAMSVATSQSGDGRIVVLHAPAGDIGGGGHVVHTGAMIEADVSVGDPASGAEGLYQDLSVRNLVRGNFVGQLYDLRNLHIPLALPIEVNEGGTLQLDLVKIMDDHTRSRIDLSQVIWETTSGPEVAVDAASNATMPFLTEDSMATIQGSFEGRAASIDLTILNILGYPTLVVNVSTNENDGVETGGISLREAIAAIDEGGTITFNSNVSGQTIPVEGSELAIGRSVSINAGDLPKGITLDGGGNSRVVSIAAGVTAELANLTISGGHSTSPGGGVSNLGDLTLRNVTVARNISESSGGGIFNSGTLSVHDSTLTENVSGTAGGGIRNESTATLTHVTLAGNMASSSGGGASQDGGSLTVHNTIVGGNAAATHPDVEAVNGGTISPTGVNLIENPDGSGLTAGATVLVDEPKLAPLGWFGGPTPTMHPLNGSPAFRAAGPPMPDARDQRGFLRGRYGDASIGAVDTQTLLTVTDPSVGGTNYNLQSALAQAVTTGPGTVIHFAPGVFPATIAVATQMTIDSTLPDGLFIDGSNIPGGVTLDAGGNGRIFELLEGSSVAMHSLNLTGGAVTGAGEAGAGGAIRNYRGCLTLVNCSIHGNTARVGGGVRSTTFTFGSGYSAWLHLSGCSIWDNEAEVNGGGVDVADVGSRARMENCTITENTSGLRGGGVFVFGASASVEILQCTVTENHSAEGGGLLARSSGEAVLHQSIVAENTASSSGPDIAKNGGSVVAMGFNLIGDNSTVEDEFPAGVLVGDSGNSVPALLAPLGDYGGLAPTRHPLPGSLAIDPVGGLTASSVATDQRGLDRVVNGVADLGAVEAGSPIPGSLRVTSSGDEFGGVHPEGLSLREAISLASPGGSIAFGSNLSGETVTLSGTQLLMDQSVVIDASDLSGGFTIDADAASRVMEVASGRAVVLRGLTLTGGQAQDGAAIYNRGVLTLERCTLDDNHATRNGGGLYNAVIGASAVLDRCAVTHNTAGGAGGGVFNAAAGNDGVNAPNVALTNTTVAGNEAFNGGGLFNNSQGGANTLTAGIMTVTHGTIVDNIASNSGGGIMNFGGLTLENTVVAANQAASAGNGPEVRSILTPSSVTYTGVNFIGDPSGTDGKLGTAGTDYLTGDPLLAPLGSYGGSTPTMPPLPGSPVIEKAVLLVSTPTTDQRGTLRPNGPLPDIGAAEAFAFSTLTLVDTDNDGIDDRLEPGLGLTVGADDRASDQDGDGQTDAQELAAMTDWSDPNSVFKISSTTETGVEEGTGNPILTITFPCFPGLTYFVDADENLDFDSPSQTLGPILPTGYSHSVNVTVTPPHDFVRVRTGN